MSEGWVYILTTERTESYTLGSPATSRDGAGEHRTEATDGFTTRYTLKRLVYAERREDVRAAIQREKAIKHWPRAWKMRLIVSTNPDWTDLYDRLV